MSGGEGKELTKRSLIAESQPEESNALKHKGTQESCGGQAGFGARRPASTSEPKTPCMQQKVQSGSTAILYLGTSRSPAACASHLTQVSLEETLTSALPPRGCHSNHSAGAVFFSEHGDGRGPPYPSSDWLAVGASVGLLCLWLQER